MKKCFSVATAVAVAFAVILLGSQSHAKEAAKSSGQPASAPTLLDDLQTAYNGEMNASAKYAAYAKKAEQEGFLKVAALYRATSKSEQVHANNHAAVIRKMGAEPKATVETPKVGKTKDNLAASIKGESYERDGMYPDFIKVADAAKNKAAVRTFTYAQKVEAHHAELYQAALDNLNAWKAGGVKFSVCAECGNTVEVVDFVKCPVCHEPKKMYSVVD